MKEGKGNIYVGMGGWQLEPFNAVFYPPNPPKGFRKLEYYSRYFDIVEVNATFYTNALTPKNAHQWMSDVSGNQSFRFSVKLFKAFTHSKDATPDDVRAIHRLLEPMAAEEKLVGLIAQFPYGFTDTINNRTYLARLSKAFSSFRLFVEVRHNSWNTTEAMAFLTENNLHLINVDLPQIKRHMPFTEVAWGDAAYFRLMGRNAELWDKASPAGMTASQSGRYSYRYREEELREFVDVIRRAAQKVGETAVIFHNDPNAHSLLNGFQIRHLLKPVKKLNIPQNLAEVHPELRALGVMSTPSPSSPPSLFDDVPQ